MRKVSSMPERRGEIRLKMQEKRSKIGTRKKLKKIVKK